MKYQIVVTTDHPLADSVVVNHAQALAEELDADGTHDFEVGVFPVEDDERSGDTIASWEGPVTA